MKKIIISIFAMAFLVASFQVNAQGVFKVQGKRTQIAYNSNAYSGEYLSFGKGTNFPFGGEWGIEYFAGGLNFWKPSPSFNNGNYKMFLSDDGFVGINMKPNSSASTSTNVNGGRHSSTVGNFRLQVTGNVISHGFFLWSDSAIKSNVTNVGNALDRIMQLRPVEYNYNNSAISSWKSNTPNSDEDPTKDSTIKSDNDWDVPSNEPKHIGLIAQEVDRIFPNLVSPIGNSQAVNYIGLIPVLIKGIQEQQLVIDSQRLEIAQLRQEIVNWQGRSIDTIGQSKSRLFQNNPNPFDGNTTITYFIDENTAVTSSNIEVRNIMGILQSTITLNDGTGLGSVTYNGSNLSPGYYIYTLKINGSVKDSKMFLKEN